MHPLGGSLQQTLSLRLMAASNSTASNSELDDGVSRSASLRGISVAAKKVGLGMVWREVGFGCSGVAGSLPYAWCCGEGGGL